MPSTPPRPPWADEIVEIAKRMRRSGVRTDVIGRVGRELDELLRRIAEDG